jgi:alpha,alpha-trehalase
MDFTEIIGSQLEDNFACCNDIYTSRYWTKKANQRKQLANTYLWNEEKRIYFDYNITLERKSEFISTTTFIPLWAKTPSKEQAKKLVKTAIPLLKKQRGIAASTKKSAGIVSTKRPQSQWNFPNGWAPHQMLIWKGLLHYNDKEEVQELGYRWLFMVTKNTVDYSETIPEKYDVVSATQKVFAEDGNIGTDFEHITEKCYGWLNATYQYGLTLVNKEYKQLLNNLINPHKLFKHE